MHSLLITPIAPIGKRSPRDQNKTKIESQRERTRVGQRRRRRRDRGDTDEREARNALEKKNGSWTFRSFETASGQNVDQFPHGAV